MYNISLCNNVSVLDLQYSSLAFSLTLYYILLLHLPYVFFLIGAIMEIIKSSKLRENLETQLSELESLQSMFYNPGEVKIEDLAAFKAIENFVNGESKEIPPFLDFTVNILEENTKFELCVNLSHEYPDIEPDVYVRNTTQNRDQHARMNKDLSNYILGLARGEPCIFLAIAWIQDNAADYIENKTEQNPVQTSEKCDQLVRYWIYSHHIYSKTKRREILNLAHLLHLTGFCMPGKPGIICVEGAASDCQEWWQTIKSMNWKRIFCKVTEECKDDRETFFKFKTFEEVIFQNNSIKCNHMDMGELYKHLERHGCEYIFKDLFGVDSKGNV